MSSVPLHPRLGGTLGNLLDAVHYDIVATCLKSVVGGVQREQARITRSRQLFGEIHSFLRDTELFRGVARITGRFSIKCCSRSKCELSAQT